MKKLMSLMAAAIMIASVSLTNVCAANTNAEFELNFSAAKMEDLADEGGLAGKSLAPGAATLTVSTDNGTPLIFRNTKAINIGKASSGIADAFTGAEAEMRHSGTLFTVRLGAKVLDSGPSSAGNRLTATVYPAGQVPFRMTAANLSPVSTGGTDGVLQFKSGGATVAPALKSAGTGGIFDGTNKEMNIQQVLYCDTNGVAMPLVEDKADLNGTGDGVRSGTDVYFLVNAPFDNDNHFKLRTSKGKNSKNIDKIDVVSKYLNKELYKVYGGQQLSGGLTTGRHTFVKVSLKELYTDDEYKITFDLKVSLTNDGQKKYPDYKETSIKEDNVTAIWLKNKVAKGDGDYRVGEKGMVIQPLSNDWNEIIWYNEARDLARLNFFADSDSKTFYSKLSTKWDHQDYASYFNGQDAFIFSFTGSPSLSSTSRADLEIYNPFLDYNDKETTDPRTVTIYQVLDGDLHDVTDKWTYQEGSNGEMAYTSRTRFLGTYIFCEKPVKEAVGKEVAPSTPELLPSGNVPEVTPEDNGGGKKPANTGKFDH